MRFFISLLFFFISHFCAAQNIKFTPEKLITLNTFLENHHSRAFIIYQNGKIINEKYFGKTINQSRDFDETTNWYWASAGKSLIAVLVGIAQQKGFLSIQEPVSKYLGKNWTNMTLEKENKIKIIHLLSMDSGLDYQVNASKCKDANCNQYKDDPEKFWYYYNDGYYLLHRILEKATGKTVNDFTENELAKKLGMQGKWLNRENTHLYFSNAKSMLNFGVLILNKGVFEGKEIFKWDDYFKNMTQSSQNFNPSYGYLWWLNGKEKTVLPGFTRAVKQSLDPFAPKDLFAALGKNGQFLDIIPSENMILVRLGENPYAEDIPIKFHREIWKEIIKK